MNIPPQSNEGDLGAVIDKVLQTGHKNDIDRLISNLAVAANLDEETERKVAEELYLTKNELLEMGKDGLCINPHGHEHLLFEGLDQVGTEKEISKSFDYISNEFHRRPDFFCLPFGRSNEFVKDIVAGLGMRGVATTSARLVTNAEDVFNLPRVSIANNNSRLYWGLTLGYLAAIKGKRHPREV